MIKQICRKTLIFDDFRGFCASFARCRPSVARYRAILNVCWRKCCTFVRNLRNNVQTLTQKRATFARKKVQNLRKIRENPQTNHGFWRIFAPDIRADSKTYQFPYRPPLRHKWNVRGIERTDRLRAAFSTSTWHEATTGFAQNALFRSEPSAA